MNRKMTIIAACVLLTAGSARGVEIKPYGFLLINYMESWGRPNLADVPTQAVSANNAIPPNQNISMLSARQTRLGLSLSGGKGPRDSDMSGALEGDFYGLRNTGSAAFDSMASAPRLRLAYIQFHRDNHTVVFGQDWTKAFAPLNTNSIAHMAVGGLTTAGNLWNRLPQLRWDAKWTLGEAWGANTRLALVRSFSADQSGRVASAPAGNNATVGTSNDTPGSGEASGGPAYQALIEFQRPLNGRPFTVGGSMQYLRQSFSTLVPPPAGALNRRVAGLLGSFHALLPISDPLTLKAEGFYGRSNMNINGLGVVYNDSGRVASSQTRGGFVQGTLRLPAGWRFNAMAGVESVDQEGMVAGSIHRNEMVLANAIWDVSPELSLSLEGWRIHSYFKAALAGDTIGVGMSAQYSFGPQLKDGY